MGTPQEPSPSVGRDEISFRELGIGELVLISDLAARIWPVVYPEIISEEQISYMLAEMNCVDVLTSSAAESGERFWSIEDGGEAIGYFAVQPRDGGELFLDKLYVLPEFHGRGIGSLALGEVARLGAALGLRVVSLRVNRGNRRAIRCYERNGFEIAGELCSEIGGGFVMDDYVMRRRL